MLGSYESWCRTMGGILEVAGVPGFLTNCREARGRTGQEEEDLRVFVGAWWQEHREERVTVADLFPLCEQRALLDSALRSPTERGRRTQLGNLVRDLQGRHVLAPDGDGGEISLAVVAAGKDRVGAAVYRLIRGAEPDQVIHEVLHEVMQPEKPVESAFRAPLQNLQNLIPTLQDFQPDSKDEFGSCACTGEGGHEVLQVLHDRENPAKSGLFRAEPAGIISAEPPQVLQPPEPAPAQDEPEREVGFL